MFICTMCMSEGERIGYFLYNLPLHSYWLIMPCSFNDSISSFDKPKDSFKTSSVFWPKSGPAHLVAPGVVWSTGDIPGTCNDICPYNQYLPLLFFFFCSWHSLFYMYDFNFTLSSHPRPSSGVPTVIVSIIPRALICSSSTISFAL